DELPAIRGPGVRALRPGEENGLAAHAPEGAHRRVHAAGNVLAGFGVQAHEWGSGALTRLRSLARRAPAPVPCPVMPATLPLYAYLWVMLGSALGGGARLYVSTLVARGAGTAFPWGTLAVNVAGCLLVGALGALF